MVEAIVGFSAGILASMGMGGGFILVVWLVMFRGMEQRDAQGVNLLFFLATALVALFFHRKNGLLDGRLVGKCAFGGIVGAALGTAAALVISGALLKDLFSLFLLFFGLRELFSAGGAREGSRG